MSTTKKPKFENANPILIDPASYPNLMKWAGITTPFMCDPLVVAACNQAFNRLLAELENAKAKQPKHPSPLDALWKYFR